MRALLGILGVALCGCATFKAMGANAEKSLGGTVKSVKSVASRPPECEALATEPIGLTEELDFGGALSLALVSTAPNGLAIDVGGARTWKGDVTRYVNLVGRQVAQVSSRPGLPWVFGVLDEPQPNAFSAPGGTVFVTTGLLRLMKSEAELAGVLAHEVAHVSLKHALRVYGDVKANQCAAAKGVGRATRELNVGVSVGGTKVVKSDQVRQLANEALVGLTDQVADFIATHGHAHDDEFAADHEAALLMSTAGYEPAAFGRLLQRLPEGGKLLALHPKTADRLAKLDACRANELAGWPAGVEVPSPPQLQGLPPAPAPASR